MQRQTADNIAIRKQLWSDLPLHGSGTRPTISAAARFAINCGFNPRVVAYDLGTDCVEIMMTTAAITRIFEVVGLVRAKGWAFRVDRGDAYFSSSTIRIVASLEA